MSFNYQGDPTSGISPSPAPSFPTAPIVQIPSDGDPVTSASVSQAFEILANFAAFQTLNGASLQSMFGDGSDGTVTVTTSSSLSKDMFYQKLTITPSGKLFTGGYRIYVLGTLEVSSGGLIAHNGNNGLGSGGGGAAGIGALQHTIGGGFDGGAGGTSGFGSGNNGNDAPLSYGGSGGNAATATGGTATAPSADGGNFRIMPCMLIGHLQGAGFWYLISGGAGGAGGDGGTLVTGGGGGGGGGTLLIAARTVINNGTIQAKGGNGGVHTSDATDGAGGGGGFILISYRQLSGSGTFDVTGGTGASTGSSGTYLPIQI